MTHAMNPVRRLVGVGVGPGDPELVTLKAARILSEADVVLVPATETSGDGPGRAEMIVRAACPQLRGDLRRVPFSMSQRRGIGHKRAESWRASADAAIAAFDAGAHTVALATVGDPGVFSTFSYLRGNVEERMSDVEVTMVPGITAMQALSAATATPLVEGREILALVPATVGVEKLGEVLDLVDSVTVYKGGRVLPAVLEQIRSRGRDAVLGTDVTLDSQQLVGLDDVAEGTTLPYFSTVMTAPSRTTTGGSL
ncbi:precorrin-2 C(20)-methyltransferase [Acidipropionibacterium jensenii]|uniref:Precorrin-2 C(20)-methyltransferase n=1 Tax=Acidipropionibacterium jensenii TaxID=1749 RepID=A0A3S5EVF6_9ACTN|nr:precorrin-2 C(20)-methyltransferase [Acidipropionibacterium jensenii]AZZ40056.1 precorrin-2 C(20)-methyltransferase [Acidipropionibacterium jensenii]MDN5976803.1 precorrin-2 C(20)-methyltransferase [Acidipropionibacterium jensenii]MDN5996982.1 precorrin-2 C(20)-methyltransferase [Acidipropionibacterium jensenii]MDN6021807.1 precorrin-2 C(20)-methyltransferase [Acidipropionibacterium jensenii]MDN6426084.1 precorrin-2 C(20)-methyltransferase [Acidipropionibacterium jensenii]